MEGLDLMQQLKESEIQKILDRSDLDATDKYVLKELIRANEKDIYFKTELDARQINAITKLLAINGMVDAHSKYLQDKEIGKLKNERVVVDMVDILLKLLVSHQRKGRGEFIQAWTGEKKKADEVKRALFTRFKRDQKQEEQEGF